MSVLDILAEKSLIDKKDIPAIARQAEESGAPVEDILVEKGISEEEMLKAKGEYFNIPTKSVGETNVPFEVLKYIPEESAVHYQFAPLGIADGVLEMGIVDPDNIEARDALNFIASKVNMPFKIFLISPSDFRNVLSVYKSLSGEVTKALSELETELSADEVEISESVESIGKAKKVPSSSTKIIEDAPVTKIVATILRYATEGNASDVHIEHLGEKIVVRFRVDGLLHTSLVLPPNVHRAMVARIKILSNMKLDEKRKPQDGRFSAHIDGRKVDFRVSTFPTYYGEKVVMRILDSEKGVMKLDKLGLTERNHKMLKDALELPYGLILMSGPTGSGKTTTLYSMLEEVDRESYNVLSLEDPVEYHIDGVNQSQVRPEIGYTFANGLRTTLRQDPDIIMVGEIRDAETAKLAVQAALTGHLVFSTIHTNSATGVIPRLIDMGVDPYLIAPTLRLAMAQRLVRTLCPGSGKPVPVEGSIKAWIEKEFADIPEKFRKEIKIPAEVYEASPSADCPNGTRGRMAVFEMLQMNREIENIIMKSPTEEDIIKVAREQGMLKMREDAILKAFQKLIPFEEVNKV